MPYAHTSPSFLSSHTRLSGDADEPTELDPLATPSDFGELDPSLGGALAHDFTLHHRHEIFAFLAAHRSLTPLLLEARNQITRVFGEPQQLVLDVQPPESREASELVLSVVSTLSPGETLAKFAQFETEWWLDTKVRVEGRLTITLPSE